MSFFMLFMHSSPITSFFWLPTWPGNASGRLVKATMDNEHEDLGIGLQLLEAQLSSELM